MEYLGEGSASADTNSPTSIRHAPVAEAILMARRQAGRAFGFDLATDPYGDMLMDVYVRQHEGRSTSLSSLWGASSVAYSTARRSVSILEARGVLRCIPDAADGRRFLVQLTPRAIEVIEHGLESVVTAGWQAYQTGGSQA